MNDLTTGSGYERRTPRETFTRTLRRICERLDGRSVFEIEDNSRIARRGVESGYFSADDVTERIEITRLWVVGSYARGALSCGDLDVLIETRCIDGRPRRLDYRQLIKPAFGTLRNVRYYEGMPALNSSRVAFPEAIEIWEKGADWGTAIATIKPDPNARRFERTGDAVPLRSEQLYGGFATEEELAEQYAKGLLSWRFLPISGQAKLEEPSDFEEHVLTRLGWGRKTSTLLPHVLRYLRNEGCQAQDFSSLERTTMNVCGIHFTLGRPYPRVQLLDELSISRVVAVPHLSRRGPNGLWEIRRGHNHPVTRAFDGLRAHAIFAPDGQLFTIHRVSDSDRLDFAVVVELFATAARARAHSKRLTSGDVPRASLQGYTVRALEGAELLDVIAQADILELPGGGEEYPTFHLTLKGARAEAVEFEPFTPEGLAAVFSRAALTAPSACR